MEILIGLARPDYERLLHKVPSQSVLYDLLRRFADRDRWASEKPFSMCVVFECNRDEALTLLEAAKQHRPQALPEIEYGIKLADEKFCR
ncbi:MAG: hypothetical protein WD688_12600 [Candidatus Binatia bacterium]